MKLPEMFSTTYNKFANLAKKGRQAIVGAKLTPAQQAKLHEAKGQLIKLKPVGQNELAEMYQQGLPLKNLKFTGSKLANLDVIPGRGFPVIEDSDFSNVHFVKEANFVNERRSRFIFKNCNLCGSDLSGLSFGTVEQIDNCDLRGAKLFAVNFGRSNLNKAKLAGTDLRLAYLIDANMSLSNVKGALMCGMGPIEKLNDSNLYKGAYEIEPRYENAMKRLSSAGAIENKNLQGIDLSGRNLENFYVPPGTDFSNADFSNMTISNCVFKDVNFSRVNFSGTKFENVILDKSDFRGADFSNAKFLGKVYIYAANLDAVNWSHLTREDWAALSIGQSSFIGADLRGAEITQTGTLWHHGGLHKPRDYEAQKYIGDDRTYHFITNFKRANMQGAKFIFSKDKPVDLSFSDFSGADLSDSVWENVNFYRNNFFIATNFKNASFNNVTEPPGGIIDRESTNIHSFIILSNFDGAKFEDCSFKTTEIFALQGLNDESNQAFANAIRLDADNEFFLDAINFSGLDLRQLDFAGLGSVYFLNCNFDGADLRGVNLGSNTGESSQSMRFLNSTFKLADLRGTNILNTIDSETETEYVDGVQEDGKRAMTYLKGARFDKATQALIDSDDYDRERFDLASTRFKAALLGLDLSNRDMSSMNFSKLDMRGVNLEESNLSSAQLKDATLNGANLKNTNWDKANIDGAQIYNAKSVHPMLKAKLEGGETAELDFERRKGY